MRMDINPLDKNCFADDQLFLLGITIDVLPAPYNGHYSSTETHFY